VGPGELWERIPADPGIDFFLKIPVGKDPGNLRVHPCPALIHLHNILQSTPGFFALRIHYKFGYLAQAR